eukprot:c4627_g1_i1.p1 GENE.c4627_g1_i1~~c4627_g1_i1.p1  ORF type:complete len:401 (-),score=58.58 c4627_g1_i1:410-1612(-)
MSRKQKPREAQGLSVAAPMMILKRPDKPTQLPQSASQSTPPPAQTFSNAPSHTPIQNYPTSPSRPKAEPRSYSRVVPTEAQTPPLKIVKPRTKSISEATPKPQPESNPATTQYQIGRRNGVNRAETVTPFFRLIDKTMNIEKGLQIESLSNEPDSLSVVVVLGTKSSGKSLIASHLFQSTSPFTDLQNQDHPKHVANDRFTNIFFREPLESVFSNTAQDKTEGVNVSINDHGVIVLDTQPVLTGVSLLENRSKSKEKDSDLISPTEEDSYLKSLHTSLFAASVSDVIVVVSDRVPNENLFQLLEATESVRQSPGPWGGEGSQTPLPRVVFVVNRVPLSMFVLGKTEKMKNQIYMRMRNSGFCRYSNDVEVHFIPEIKPGQEWVRRFYVFHAFHRSLFFLL